MSNMMETLGQNLARIRVEKGLTEIALATLLGISQTELAGIENGTADVETGFIYKAASVLEVEIENLLCSDQTRNQLLEQIKNKLDTCSEQDLVLVFEYLSSILKINSNSYSTNTSCSLFFFDNCVVKKHRATC